MSEVDTSAEAVERYQPYGGAGKLPVHCCDFSVVDNSSGKEICRAWSLEEAQTIAFVMNRATERDEAMATLRAQLSKARNDALEEAAVITETEGRKSRKYPGETVAETYCDDAAELIRELKSQEKK